jgi:signal transduction histidine kinase
LENARGEIFPEPSGIFVTVGIASLLAFWVDQKSRDWLQRGGEQILADLRATVIAIARTEPNPDRLSKLFEEFLCARFQTTCAVLFFDQKQALESKASVLAKSHAAYPLLCGYGWATPESLQRRRSTPTLEALAGFLHENSFAVVVTSPRGSPAPSLLLALGPKSNQWPYTYPEVQRLQSIAELMDNVLARSRLATEAALKAKIEHLAMMSRGLAHDLKNLITPISSFLVHSDGRFAPGSPEAEVHAAASRSVGIMTRYVRESLFFSDRLEPKFESIELYELLYRVRELTAARAAPREVATTIVLPQNIIFVADCVLLERLLTNLVSNAIDASSPGQEVKIATAETRHGWIRLQVIDEGSGISAANLGRIFDPYFTTKHFADDLRGFGLGLTICRKIAQLHGGTISVQSELEHGTVVSVDLPCAPVVAMESLPVENTPTADDDFLSIPPVYATRG